MMRRTVLTSRRQDATQAAGDDADRGDAADTDAVSTQDLGVGSSVTFEDGVTLTLDSVEPGLTNYDGSPVIGIHVTYVNNGDAEFDYNGYNWKGRDAQGAATVPGVLQRGGRRALLRYARCRRHRIRLGIFRGRQRVGALLRLDHCRQPRRELDDRIACVAVLLRYSATWTGAIDGSGHGRDGRWSSRWGAAYRGAARRAARGSRSRCVCRCARPRAPRSCHLSERAPSRQRQETRRGWCAAAELNETFGYQIFKGQARGRGRDTVLRLAIALGCNLVETRRLLQAAGV